MNKLRALKNKKGFTLIELIIVIVIIAILAAIAIPAMSGFKKDAEKSAAEANARTAYTALSAAGAKYAVAVVTGIAGAAAEGNDYTTQAQYLLGSAFPGTVTSTIADNVVASVTWNHTNGKTKCTFTAATGAFTHA